MNAMFGVRWNDNVKRGTLAGFMVAALFATSFLSTPEAQQSLSTATSNFVSVIVRSEPGTNGDRIARVVQDLGGTVEEELKIINGYVAKVPADRVHQLKSNPAVSSVTMNGRVQMLSHDDYGLEEYARDVGSLNYVAQGATGAVGYYRSGYTGRGVDVALIDSGVAPVEGLTRAGKVVYGPDLSFESQVDGLRDNDTFGHGTHMAGIIAGMDSTFERGVPFFAGVAPEARVVSVKVADSGGATDVSQIIAAIDWVVQHRNDNGMNIRVLNLSFGTDGTQDYRLDPLTYAAEVAWRKGIVVVVAAGNNGYGSAKLNNPAYDPFVISVGGSDTKGTWTTSDDTLGEFSSHGDGSRNPDVVAPGKSIVSLRTPGSAVDVTYPQGQVGERFFRGSGTSQAAAVVSGAAALIIDQRPGITPDQVKALLTKTADRLPAADSRGQGAGLIDLREAKRTSTPWNATQL
ncbi:MAG: S8 family serine peptidase, partial [Actinomycetota bacterium]